MVFLGAGPDSCSQGMASNHYRDRARQNVSDAAYFRQFPSRQMSNLAEKP